MLAALDADLSADLVCGWQAATEPETVVTEDGVLTVPEPACTGRAIAVIQFAAVCDGGEITGLPDEILACRAHFALATFLQGRCGACGAEDVTAAEHTIADVHLIRRPDVR
jgi:hypothetical protein